MRFTARVAIALAAMALVAVACGDDDATTTTVAPSTTTGSTAVPATTSVAPATTAAVPGGESDAAELLARFAMTPARTTYLLGTGDNETELIVAQDPTATPPIEAITIVENNSKIIISDGMTIFCDGSSNMCFEVPGGGGSSLVSSLLGPLASGVFLEAGPNGAIPGVAITEQPVSIAGRSGICFTYEAPDGYGADITTLRQCIDDEFGFTLLMEASEGGGPIERVMELTAFAPPTAEDFEPTGPVTASP
jgi:hypothetical protein